MMAEDYDLRSPQPIMCNTPESGDCLYMFQSGSKYYICLALKCGPGRI